VHWYRCRNCSHYWMRIVFEGYHTKSSTFYATHVEPEAIESFHMDHIDEIFLASDMTFVGGYDCGDRTSVYLGGFPLDPWYGFRRQERLQKAQEFALKAHGQQMYGKQPYKVHLEHVHEVMMRYRRTHEDLLLLMGSWLHDALEDTPTSKTELKKNFGEEIADMVFRVTDEPGADRAEKKRKTYPKIRGHKDATILKLCDRIANVEASSNVPEKLKMYWDEHREFSEALRVEPFEIILAKLWEHLDQLLSTDHKR